MLSKIRVYTRLGRSPTSRNLLSDRGTTVLGAARDVHKRDRRISEIARVWGKGVFEGQMVPRDHVLNDGDIVVFYT